MKAKRHWGVLLALALLLIGCSSNPQPLPADSTTAPQAMATVVPTETATSTPVPTQTPTTTPTPAPTPNPLTIESLQQRAYPGSDIAIEETLPAGSNYSRYIASYQSDGLKIYALLTVPNGEKPPTGWPVIVFNHGYIPPGQYRTTERYVAYQDALARAGYITFKSDYRGNGDSEGTPSGHFAPGYTIDVLNAVGSLKKYADADPNRIGMWGHSLGGEITLRAMVIQRDIKAGVIWAGTVAPLAEQLDMWGRGTGGGLRPPHSASGGSGNLAEQYGTPEENPEFWASLSANSYLGDLSGPLQLHHGTADTEVPLSFSQALYDQVKQAGQTAELYTYPGGNHNFSQGFDLAMQRTVEFFDKYVKGTDD
ncbi:MAG TPA: prolyl oligopeptidase family serine peptidase [Anaerolineae bacterium]|nr:prolyl oligopeptidase family serine peptidase [Anaerolineae bacterium]